MQKKELWNQSMPHQPSVTGDAPMQIEAEKIVLAANGRRGLATVALRPSGIFGEWDRLFVPLLVEKAKQGKMKFIIGSGRNLMEYTYAGNVADAHVLVGLLRFCRIGWWLL